MEVPFLFGDLIVDQILYYLSQAMLYLSIGAKTFLLTYLCLVLISTIFASANHVCAWFSLTPSWIIINFVAYFGAWFIAFFYEDRDGPINNNNSTGIEPRLPPWLSWFATDDNSLLGDDAWKNMEPGHWEWRKKLDNYPMLQAYFGRMGWLMRNPAYGFERTQLSAVLVKGMTVTWTGNPLIQDQPNGVPGVCVTHIGRYWNFSAIIPLGQSCIKLNFGWKLKTHAEAALKAGGNEVLEDDIGQYVVAIGIKKYTPV